MSFMSGNLETCQQNLLNPLSHGGGDWGGAVRPPVVFRPLLKKPFGNPYQKTLYFSQLCPYEEKKSKNLVLPILIALLGHPVQIFFLIWSKKSFYEP